MVSETDCADEVQVDELDMQLYNLYLKKFLMDKTTYEVRTRRFWIKGGIVPENKENNS